jgi:membrane-bound serine protease (ClpP class)
MAIASIRRISMMFLSLFILYGGSLLYAQEAGGPAILVPIEGIIGPAIADYVSSSFERARSRGASMIVLQMDTPGGLAKSMRSLIREILASEIPVAAFVGPAGARAASAGTYILYASHIAAMAPGTNMGAATPVQFGGGQNPFPTGRGREEKERGKEEQGEGKGETAPMEAKLVNDAAAFIRSLAELRGRNAEWAEKSVRQAASITAEEAIENNVIDLTAADVASLLEGLDGRTVEIQGRKIRLNTADIQIVAIEPNWRTKLLSIITNPNIAFILMLVGIYGLIFEFATPGSIGPGIIGVVCLLLALYAFHVLPLNYTGAALILLAVGLMTAEAFVPSFGILGFGGIAAFVIGALMLFDVDLPGVELSWSVIGGTAAFSFLMLVFLLGYAIKAQRRRVSTGREDLIGRTAEVLDWSGESGWVRVAGERWKATGAPGLTRKDSVKIREVRGLDLVVDLRKTSREDNEK